LPTHLFALPGVTSDSWITTGTPKILAARAGKKESFKLVGEWEADPMEKKISHESPLGKALLGRQIGEKVEVAAPAGKILYTIIDVK